MTAERRRGIEYFESLQYLEGRKFAPLESAARLLAALGNPQDAVPAIHVAGTNGKGSVCAMLSSMLIASGFRTGQTSSPHLSTVCERCLVGGHPISEDDFGRAVEEIVSTAQREGIAPSYFVLGIVVAFTEFARRRLDRMVVEVGLGGTSDATNLITRPLASVITGISIDHAEIIGPELRDIAEKKAGIAKSGVPLFVGEVTDEVREVIAERAARAGAPVEFLGRDFFFDEASDELVLESGRVPARTRELRLQGEHQVRNAALAARVGYALGLSPENIGEGLRRARWPGRLEWLDGPEGRRVLLDVAHNVEGVEALCRYLLAQKTSSFVFVVSILGRKDWRGMLRCWRELLGAKEVSWIFTDSGYPGAVAPAELSDAAGAGISESNAEHALERAFELAPATAAVVVSGSVYLVGRLRPKLTTQPVTSIAEG